MRKTIAFVLLAAGMLAAPVWANHGGGQGKSGQCSMHGGDCSKGDCGGKEESCGCPIMSMTMKKAMFFLKNADEIGLSEDQVKQIKAIKLEAKKAMIQQKAGMEIGMLDLETKLSEPKLDVAAINQSIDAGMAEMATGAKAAVERLAKLKAVLNDQQMAKAKEIWKKKS